MSNTEDTSAKTFKVFLFGFDGKDHTIHDEALSWWRDAVAVHALFADHPIIMDNYITYRTWCKEHQVQEDTLTMYRARFRCNHLALAEKITEPKIQEVLFINWFIFYRFHTRPPYTLAQLDRWAEMYIDLWDCEQSIYQA